MKSKKKSGDNRKPWAVALLVAVAAFVLPALAHAQAVDGNRSWADPVRLSAAVGGGYVWHTGEESNLPTTRKEFELGAFGAYNVVPGFSAAAYAVRGFENRTWRSGIGPRLGVWKSPDGQHAASVSLRYAWHAGPDDELPAFRHEWETGAEYGFAFSKNVVLGGYSAYGLDSHTFRSSVGVRYRLY